MEPRVRSREFYGQKHPFVGSKVRRQRIGAPGSEYSGRIYSDTGVYTCDNNEASISVCAESLVWYYCAETMRDYPGKEYWKPIEHTKLYVKVLPGQFGEWTETNLVYPWIYKTFWSAYPVQALAAYTNWQNRVGLETFPTPWNLNDCLDRAYAELVPTSADSSDANVLQFLIELKDFRQLAGKARAGMKILKQGLPAAVTALRKTMELFGTRLKRLKSPQDFGRALALVSSDARLQWSFAIKPMVADIENLKEGFYRVQEWVDRWNEEAQKGKVTTFHCEFSQWLKFDDSYVPLPRTGKVFTDGQYHVNYIPELKGFAHLSFTKMKVDDKGLARMIKLHDSMGIGKGTSIAWECLPFSFLIDYVAKVGDLLEGYDVAFRKMPISKPTFHYSLKTSMKWHTRTNYKGGLGRAEGCSSRYTRQAHIPPNLGSEWWRAVPPSTIELTIPSWGQMLNVIALITAKLFGGRLKTS